MVQLRRDKKVGEFTYSNFVLVILDSWIGDLVLGIPLVPKKGADRLLRRVLISLASYLFLRDFLCGGRSFRFTFG